ncbi:unnamed protein product [Vitrella brassicaformis CCMP3155]|uniref:Helicase C-terminal domain-containing protein n=1 Tax=Vitrella brassicaformis (strain CCMP3155) TaxID=1169540 RepID=A0A0G4FNH6_VITBC|nr:unnamed protein product [Vitrella brassicaformis CCMP3155]|eukprot:CEM15078.1 unnamed protein product [Vitrella brassicaformis CCMP3155]
MTNEFDRQTAPQQADGVRPAAAEGEGGDRRFFDFTYSEARRDAHRVRELKQLLKSERWVDKKSILISTWRRQDADILTEALTKAGPFGAVEAYHGGRGKNHLANVESKFASGALRIVVATSAFCVNLINTGVLNGLIYYSTPQSFEALRADLTAWGSACQDAEGKCHVFLRPDELMTVHRATSEPSVDPWAAIRLIRTLTGGKWDLNSDRRLHFISQDSFPRVTAHARTE